MASRVLRAPGSESARVTNLELFFDLVYVFAITQLSEFLLKHLTLGGALRALVLFGAVWWAWNLTAWATNWIDPDRPIAAIAMLVMMALSLFMSAALPEAFGPRGAPFAIAYVALQVGRSAFVAWAFGRGDSMRANALQLLAWSVICGAGWIVGAYLGSEARLIVWAAALVVELIAPLHGFRLPGLPGIAIERWRLSGALLAERYQLIVMIALGESVLRVGAAATLHSGSISRDAAWVIGFVASAALWGAYFLRLADEGAERAETASEGRSARVGRGYAYAHAAMVAGVVVIAVAIQLVIDRPEAPVAEPTTLCLLGGPALYLVGLGLYERAARIGSEVVLAVAVAALALLVVPAALGADDLIEAACATVVLVALAATSLRGAE